MQSLFDIKNDEMRLNENCSKLLLFVDFYAFERN